MTIQAVADLVGGRLSGPGAGLIRRVRSLEQADSESLAMCASGKHAAAMQESAAAAVLVPQALENAPGPLTKIVVRDPARAMYVATVALFPASDAVASIDSTAHIGAGSVIGQDASIGPHVVIGTNVQIGDRARLGPGVVIEDDVQLGDDVRLDAHVTIYAGARLGHRVWCKASAVIGAYGFGFSSSAKGHERIPHVGGCIVGDDVDVGSNSCIDRGTLDDTIIGRGTKIDNMVHIAHNVHIGADSMLMAQVGLAGSVVIGDRVILAGKSGVSNHVRVGNDARIGAYALVIADVPSKGTVSGMPARPHLQNLRGIAAMYRLSEHVDTLESMAKERGDG